MISRSLAFVVCVAVGGVCTVLSTHEDDRRSAAMSSTERVFAYVALGISCCWIASIVVTVGRIELAEPHPINSFVQEEVPPPVQEHAKIKEEIVLDLNAKAMEFDAEIKEFQQLGLVPVKADAWKAFREGLAIESQTSPPERERPRITAATVVDVFVDWPRSTFLFSSHNYVALESLLSLAAARVTALLVAPSKTTMYRYSNANSYVQFERYKKLGHNVVTEIINVATVLYPSARGGPGSTWWTLNRRSCCPQDVDFAKYYSRDDLDVVPSPGTTLYFRLQKLWLHGGWFADLDLFWLQNPVPGTRGFNVGCANKDAPPSMILAFPDEKDPVLACFLEKYDECGRDSECTERLAASAGAVFELCFENQRDQENDLEGLVEWLDCKNDRAHKMIFGESDLELEVEEAFALWLGPDATDGEWSEPSPRSFFARILSSRLATFRVGNRACARWIESQELNQTVSCPRLRPGLAGLSSRFDRRDQRLADRNCAPRIFIPAAQKGASSYVFSLLMTHPQTLPPLRGAQYKEPGAYANAVYYRQPFSKRVSRFPFVRPSEGLVSLDGTVSYAIESRLPAFRIALDSPTAKIIFALREPVDRSFSDYRFCYRPFFQDTNLGWDEAILQLIPLYDTCFHNSSSLDTFYEPSKCRRTDRYGLIRKSLYYYQVAFFGQVFGKENVLVVTSEQLRQDASAVGKRAAQFAGLCPFDFQAIPPVHVTQLQPAPRHFWSKAVYYKLRAWFEPYNERLFRYLGAGSQDLGWSPVREPKNFRI